MLQALSRARALRAALTLASLGVVARADAAGAAKPVIEAPVLRALRTGIVAVDALARTPDRAPVVIELAAPADERAFAALRAAGAELGSAEGRTLAYDRFVPAHVSEAAVRALAASSLVRRVSLAPAQRVQPLDHSAELVHLDAARGARPALDRLTGAGMLIGDSDSLVDVFQPAFFRADAGYYDWIDVDGDKVFTPGVDAIDLDGDGKASPGEIARLLRSRHGLWAGSWLARR